MPYVVKEADLQLEKQNMLSLLTGNRERQGFDYDKRYDWLYRDNPCGKATAWIIWDESSGDPAGFTAVFPRHILVKGQELTCWNCGDFSIEKKHRALGVAVQLRKEAKRHVDEGNIPFLYAHPNNRMVHIHMRAKHKKIAEMRRFALPIRLGRYLEKKPFGKLAGGIIDPLGSTMLRFKYRRNGEYEVLDQTSMNFDNRYRELCEKVSADYPVIGLRDGAYLKWKFQIHPNYRYELFNYYKDGQLAGYIIFGDFDGTINLPEVVCPRDAEIQRDLLSTFIHYLLSERKNAYVVSMIVQEYHPILQTLESHGFKFRDDATSSVIAYSNDPQLKPVVEDGKNWFMTVGDRDA